MGLVLSACSHQDNLPTFTSTGYLADRGAVRIWRKETSGGNTHIMAAFSPLSADDTTIGDYRWHDDQLTLLELNIAGKAPQQIKIRFAENGELSFMQREVNGQKQQLSEDQIALYLYRARQIKEVSDALRIGHVVLYQGRWQGNNLITTCEGASVVSPLDTAAVRFIERRQSSTSVPVSLAWLEAPEGTQLLLVANEDFCTWQPEAETF